MSMHMVVWPYSVACERPLLAVFCLSREAENGQKLPLQRQNSGIGLSSTPTQQTPQNMSARTMWINLNSLSLPEPQSNATMRVFRLVFRRCNTRPGR
ncbi:hypothetical protein EMIT0P294_11260 [Pseudomonas sp. IT-P294]